MQSKLYVGNLSYSTTDEDLRQLFAQAGAIKEVIIITDRETRRSKGFGLRNDDTSGSRKGDPTV